MTEKRVFRLVHSVARNGAAEFCQSAPDGWIARFTPPTRSLEMNAKFHAICSDLAKSGLPWAGKERSADQWKVLLVSGHAIATKEGAEILPGIEGEFVNIRESTAIMSNKRGSSLIDYSIAFCAMHDVKLRAHDGEM